MLSFSVIVFFAVIIARSLQGKNCWSRAKTVGVALIAIAAGTFVVGVAASLCFSYMPPITATKAIGPVHGDKYLIREYQNGNLVNYYYSDGNGSRVKVSAKDGCFKVYPDSERNYLEIVEWEVPQTGNCGFGRSAQVR